MPTVKETFEIHRHKTALKVNQTVPKHQHLTHQRKCGLALPFSSIKQASMISAAVTTYCQANA